MSEEDLNPRVEIAEEAPAEPTPSSAVVPNFQDAGLFLEATTPFDPLKETLVLPPASPELIEEVLAKTPNLDMTKSPEEREWLATFKDGQELFNAKGAFDTTVERDTADFRQGVEFESRMLNIGAPSFKANVGQKVSGGNAVLRMRSLLGMGSIVQVPLWHSGFWITFKAPSEGAVLELQRRLEEEKILLGRQTSGLVFANTSVYINQYLTEFVLEHLHDKTLILGEEPILKYVSSLDLPTLIWGLTCALWPDGFQYTRACINDPEKCQHVVRAKLNVNKLLWVDNLALTPWQRAHMSNRGGSTMSLESVKRYQEEFTRGKSRVIDFKAQGYPIEMEIATPNVLDYLSAGQRWITTIVDMITGALAEDPQNDRRNRYISAQAKATNMRQYAHWVKSITVDGVITDDLETLEEMINSLSEIDEIRPHYFEQITKFIDDATIAITGVPNYDCPVCGTEQHKGTARFARLLPIDMMTTFFILLAPKLRRVHLR